MVSIIPAGGDRHSVLYQNRMEQVKSPIVGTQAPTYSKNPRTYTDSTSGNNFQTTSSYLQNQNRNISNSNVQGTTRASRLHNPNYNADSLHGDMKSAHSRSASMPEAVYLKVHHHKPQTAVVPPNHFQPLELPHQQKQYEGSTPTSNTYTQRLVPAQLPLAHPAPQNIAKPILPHLSHYYGPFIKVQPKLYPSSNYSQHSIYGPLPHQPQHPAVSLRRSHTNAGDYLGRRRDAKLSTFNGKSNPSPTTRALSPHLQTSSGLLNRAPNLADQTDHVMNIDCGIQNAPRLMYGVARPGAGLARSRSNIAAIGGANGLPYNQHRPTERDSVLQPPINLRAHHIGRRSNLARATSFYHPSAAGTRPTSNEAFGISHAGHMRSSSMLASLTTGIPPTFGERNIGGSRKLVGKDICKPLHVDCSIEYDLGNQPKIPKDSAPLLIIHPAYHNVKKGNEDHSPRFHPYTEGKEIDNTGKRCPSNEESKKLTRSAPPKSNKYQQNNPQQRHGRGVTRHSSFAYPSSAGHISRKLMPLNLDQEFHSDFVFDHNASKKGPSLAHSRSSSNLRNAHQINRRIQFDNNSTASKQLKLETRYNKENEKIMFEREKESVHLSMLDITMEKEQEVPKDHFYFKEQLFHEKSGERKGVSVVRRGTSVTASSKPSFPRDLRKANALAMNIHSSKPKQQPKAKVHISGKLAAARKSSTGSRDSGAASSLEADSSGGFNSFLSTMTVVSSLGSSGIGECKRDISLSNKESLSPSPEFNSMNENTLTRLKCIDDSRGNNSINTPYRDEAKMNIDNKAVTKIRITNQDETQVQPIASNNMPISTTNVKLIQNRFTQQVQNLSNNFCDSGLGTPSSLNDTKSANGSNHRITSGINMVSTTPDGQLSSSVLGNSSNNSSNQNTNSSKSSLGFAMKGYMTSSSTPFSSTSKWKSSMSGLVNGFLCCSMRHRHNSYSSSTASSPNMELHGYAEQRPLGCKTESQRANVDNQPLRNYFVNSISVSPKDSRTVEAQLAPYNWPNNQNERNSLSRNPSFLMSNSSEFNSLVDSKPSSSITVIPPQGGNWNAVLSNPNYSQHERLGENASQGPDLVRNAVQSEGSSISHKDQIKKRTPWINHYTEDNERRESTIASDPKIRVSSPSMSTSNTSSGEGLGSSVMSSGSSTSNPSSLSQSTGNFLKHKVLIEGRSESSSSSTTSSSSFSSSSGTADFTSANKFHRDSMVGVGFHNTNNKETRIMGLNKDATYQEHTSVPTFVDEDQINDNINPSQEKFSTYYWNGNNDDNEIYSSSLHHEVKAKRNSAMLMSSGIMKEEHRNQKYSSPPVPSVSSQQNNIHNLTMNANFMRPIHI